jgi:short-subunit dehydrogenase
VTDRPAAVVVGASSGIGAAIARRLAADGWRVGLVARRLDRLEALAAEIDGDAVTAAIDLRNPEAARRSLSALVEALGGSVGLFVLNAGVGHLNPDLAWEPERETIEVNVLGFAAAADVAMAHLLARGSGRIVGVSSIARFRGGRAAPSYGASKAFVSLYLDGLRDLVRHRRVAITVTEACPGFVDTPMMKAPNPFWVASADKAARQIVDATLNGRKLVYVTRRWRLIAWLLRLLPR